ncbi:MAG: ABC transporter permease [Acholeplasmataceae bacterium]
MKKLRFLIKFGLLKRIARKSFLIANIVIAVLLIGFINLPAIINLFASGDPVVETVNVKLYTDEALSYGPIADQLSQKLNVGLETEVYQIEMINQFNETIVNEFWENNNDNILIYLTGTDTEPILVLYSKLDYLNSFITNSLQYIIIEDQVGSFPTLSYLYEIDPNADDGLSEIVGSMSTLLILPLFILITMATQFVGVDIIEEKSTKAIETIIASVPARTHFLSKIIASILFVLIQALIVAGVAVIGALLGNLVFGANQAAGNEQLLAYLGQAIPNWPIVLLFTLLFIIFGTLMYLIIAALFASMAVTQEDYQQFQTPLMMILLLGFYISIFGSMFGSDAVIKISSFIPIFTPIVAPVAIMMGTITHLEALIAVIILIGFDWLLMIFVAPAYRVAILSYEQTKFFTRIKTVFKKARAK